MSLIHIENLTKHFKILNRRDGLSGAFRFAFTDAARSASWLSTRRSSFSGRGKSIR